MWRLALLAALLGGCALLAARSGPLRVDQVLEYGARQQSLAWFYGRVPGGNSGEVIQVGSQTLELSPPPSHGGAVLPGTLLVSGHPALLSGTTPLSAGAVFAVSAVPFSGQLLLQTREAVQAVVYDAAGRWFRLSGPLAAGRGGRVSPVFLPRGPAGVGELTSAEAGAVEEQFAGRGNFALALLPASEIPDAPLYISPAPVQYRRTALVVQRGVPLDLAGNFAPLLEQPLATSRVAAGDLGARGPARFSAALDADQASVDRLWSSLEPGQNPPILAGGQLLLTLASAVQESGGYALKLLSVSQQGGQLSAVVQLLTPPPGSINAMALSSPWLSAVVSGAYGVRSLVVRSPQGVVLATAALDGGISVR
jgi:hypothetical protein